MYGGFTQHAFIVVGSSQLNHTYINAHTTTISVLGYVSILMFGLSI